MESNVPIWLALIPLVIGVFIIALALGIIPEDPGNFHAPPIVVGLAGAVFLIGGLSLLVKAQSAWRAIGAALILGCMGAVGAWVTFFGDSSKIEGGLPFLSQETNALLGRGVFGVGTLLVLCFMVWAIKDAQRRMQKEKG